MKLVHFKDYIIPFVKNGQKTQFRRICKDQNISELGLRIANKNYEYIFEQPLYKKGEIVAVSETYNDIVLNHLKMKNEDKSAKTLFSKEDYKKGDELCLKILRNAKQPWFKKGCDDKLFVRAGFMPTRIKITDVRIERLKEIKKSDCVKECPIVECWENTKTLEVFNNNILKFSIFINRMFGKYTWDNNPYVWVYDFEVVQNIL